MEQLVVHTHSKDLPRPVGKNSGAAAHAAVLQLYTHHREGKRDATTSLEDEPR